VFLELMDTSLRPAVARMLLLMLVLVLVLAVLDAR
jgi:hypothetical protein